MMLTSSAEGAAGTMIAGQPAPVRGHRLARRRTFGNWRKRYPSKRAALDALRRALRGKERRA